MENNIRTSFSSETERRRFVMRQTCFASAFSLFVLLVPIGCEDSTSPSGSPQNSAHDAPDGESHQRSSKRPPHDSPVRFVDRAAAYNISFQYRNNEEQHVYSMVETLGGGAGVFDYDRNGWPDLLFAGGGRFETDHLPGLPSVLYRNLGDETFQKVSSAAGIGESRYYSHGVSVGDYNSDGFPDVVLTGFGGLQFFTNQGDGTFRRESAGTGLDEASWSVTAAWGDVTGDGFPDLYVARYLNWSPQNNPVCMSETPGQRQVCKPADFEGLSDSLYRNNGDGTFTDISSSSGLVAGGKGLGAILADLDGDTDLDIYVTNDTMANFCYQNQGEGRFEEMGVLSGTAFNDLGRPDGSMGVALGDCNKDGLFDIGVTNYVRETFALYRNSDAMNFMHVSQLLGLTAVGRNYVGWGMTFLDFDLDGDEDLLLANGHVYLNPTNAPLRQPMLIYENMAGRKFLNVTDQAGAYATAAHRSRGLAKGDLDRDGREDVVLSNCNEPVAILMNRTETGNRHWLGIRLCGRQSDRFGIGATVTLLSADNQQVRQLYGGSYASTHEPVVVFGLGETELPQTVEIQWPSGKKQIVKNLPPNRYHQIIEAP